MATLIGNLSRRGPDRRVPLGDVPRIILAGGGVTDTSKHGLFKIPINPTRRIKTPINHTLLRLPTGIFYAQGVKANVLFFDAKPAQEKQWTKKVWIYDLRTNMHFTLKTTPMRRSDLDEFVTCYKPGEPHEKRRATWTEKRKPDERWRSFTYNEIIKRDKANLDIFWLRDKSLEDSDDLPDPDILAQEIADDLQTALEQFSSIAAELTS